MPTTRHALLVTALLGLALFSDAYRVKPKRRNEVRVGTLGGHTPASYSGACNQTADGSLARAECNLNVYEEAARTAQSRRVDLLVLPEYGLINGGGSAHREVPPSVGDQPCGLQDSAQAQVARLSCIARQYSVALAANLQTTSGGNTLITSIVYDKNGTVQAVYHKNRLFPGEGLWATSGPFSPSVFELFGQKWGLCICYEAMDPFAGWAQFHSFRDQGAQNILWSVGNTVWGSVLVNSAQSVAREVQMNVFGTMNVAMAWGDTTTLVGPDGRNLTRTTADLGQEALSSFGYRGSAFIHYATVSA